MLVKLYLILLLTKPRMQSKKRQREFNIAQQKNVLVANVLGQTLLNIACRRALIDINITACCIYVNGLMIV
jgi:hypothetical protein